MSEKRISILIANRGEPVRRALQTFRKRGFRVITIAVDDDLRSPWVAESDHVERVPSYTDIDAIVAAARQSSADAVWPGWGFLSENEKFARAIEEAGLIWIGPSSASIALMGSKSQATKQAQAAGFVTIPEIVIAGDVPIEHSLPEAIKACRSIGFPALLKPALGGGGQGQVVLHAESELKSAWEAVHRINAKQFHAGPILVQKYFAAARHVEAQVLCDRERHVVILGERDCSVQRRNQKVIEEAPCPIFSPAARAEFMRECTRLVQHIGYDNVGTIECLYAEGKIYFLEMNTRLQVEHTVTEEIVRVRGERIDLVDWMWRVATGESLSFTQEDVTLVGHAVEARIYAEDPKRDFSPAPGLAHFVKFPRCAGVRVESAMGDHCGTIHSSYDPMIAKIIVHANDRAEAIAALDRALAESVVLGVVTNLSFCREILRVPDFVQGFYDTRFLQKHKMLRGETPKALGLACAVAAAIRALEDLAQVRHNLRSPEPTSLFHVLRQIPQNGARFELEFWGKKASVTVACLPDQMIFACVNGVELQFRLTEMAEKTWSLFFDDGQVMPVWIGFDGHDVQMSLAGDWYRLRLQRAGEASLEKDPHAAPMAGQLVGLFVKPGDAVSSGQELFQIESMKMVTTIRSVRSGNIQAVHKMTGDSVKSGEAVVSLSRMQTDALVSGKQLTANELGSPVIGKTLSPFAVLQNYFSGFDVTLLQAQTALQKAFADASPSEMQVQTVVEILRHALVRRALVHEHAHAFAFLVERGAESESLLPRDILQLLETILPAYGLRKTSDFATNPVVLIRLLQACHNDAVAKENLLTSLLVQAAKYDVAHADLAGLLQAWFATKPLLKDTERAAILLWLSHLDINTFQMVAHLAVSLDYWEEFRLFDQNPGAPLSPDELQTFQREMHNNSNPFLKTFPENVLPKRYQDCLQKWFAAFAVRCLPLPAYLQNHGLQLFELKHSDAEIGARFVVTARVTDLRFTRTKSGEASLPGFERASIEAYRTLRLLQAVSPHQNNHVFLLADCEEGIPWKTRDDESKAKALTPELARQIAARVSGFANDVRIIKTEAILPLHKLDTNKLYWTIIEVRHAKPYGVISRPPFLLEERAVENPRDRLLEMNENQHRMGKLVNRDRAMLLFDEGEFIELKFPEVDDVEDVGLNVYRGKVCGIPTLAYASDFRLRGGALGEREGKKLAASVVLAYLTQEVLVGFHDGAGANIKESVASLGWAGAYFGAIANTGGFSDAQTFSRWFTGHAEKNYFMTVLKHFDLADGLQERMEKIERQLVHFHLHVGATVGMLVYGASIASMSLMNDQPESYRVLTGSAAVKRVIGEDATNAQLGGAKAHAEESGDIEMSFASEEQVINRTRQLIVFLQGKNHLLKIRRDVSLPKPDVLPEAGVLMARDALRAQLDDGEFFETRAQLKQAFGLITGYGALAGQPAALICATTDYGNFHAKGFKKAAQLVYAAQDLQLPLIFACGAQWEAPSKPVASDWLLARNEFTRAVLQLKLPKISLAFGPRSIEKVVHQIFDFTIAVQRGNETAFEKERLRHFAPFVVESMQAAYDVAAKLLPYLLHAHPVWQKFSPAATDPVQRLCQFVLPKNLAQSYDMRAVVHDVFDHEQFLELWANDALPLITGLARLGGRVVGVIADNPQIEAGAQSVGAIAKFTRFHRLCERLQIPIVELSDSPAFRPGSEQEHGGIQGEGGKSIREECLSPIAKIVVTLRQNYGGRLIHANLITLGPKRRGLILQNAKIGVMGAKGAVVVLARKLLAALPENERTAREAQWISDYEQKQLNPAKAVELGYVDPPIAAQDLRQTLHQVLQSFTDE